MSTDDDDRDYYRARAEAELKMAEVAGHAEARRVHFTLAGHYFDRALDQRRSPQSHDGVDDPDLNDRR